MLPFMRDAVLCLTVLLFCSSAYAADFRAHLNGYGDFGDETDFSIEVSGEIQPGDKEKLVAALGNREVLKGAPIYLDLDSPGGNFEEGLKIAQFMLEQRLSTRLGAKAQCLSACAIIFMAGTRFTTVGSTLERKMHKTAKLGFHAPTLSIGGGDEDPEQLDEAYTAAVEGIGNKLLTIARFRGRRWNNQLIKSDLVNEMMLRRGKNFYYIDTVRKAASNDIELIDAGGPEDSAQSILNSCKNAYAALISDGMADSTWYGDISPAFQSNKRDIDYRIPLSRGQCIVSGSTVTVSEENDVEGVTYRGDTWIGWPGSKRIDSLPDDESEPMIMYIPGQVPPLLEPTTCSSLWRQRNELFHQYSYCFTGAKGIEMFGNNGCFRTQDEVWSVLDETLRNFVVQVRNMEKQMACNG